MRVDRRSPSLAMGMATLLAGGTAVAPADPGAGSLESVPGVHIATFRMPAGSIYVNLPDDLLPGDTASATVNPVPAAAGERDQARQRRELNSYLVELDGQRAPASQPVRTFTVPAGAPRLAVVLFDPRGRPAGEVNAPLGAAALPPPSYRLPPLGQSGGPVRITGAFDGDLSDSSVKIGGKPAQPMAESPRQLVVRGPQEEVGPAPMEVSERGQVVARGTYRNVGVRLSAPTTNLLSGQHTTLTITVTGVEALREALPLRLANKSPDVVHMEGGEEQTLCVRPDDIGPSGTWTKTRGLTGVRAGGFSIGTELGQPGPQAESSSPTEAILHGELLERLALDRPARTAAGDALSPGAYQIVVRGAGEHGRVRLLLWRDGKTAGTLDGAVLERRTARTICDVRDAAAMARQAESATGDRSFSELGFTEDGAFAVHGDAGRLRLVLTTLEGVFSIETELASP